MNVNLKVIAEEVGGGKIMNMPTRFDPLKHHRRSIRLKGWDYSSPAAYFVTICTHKRINLFDNRQFRSIAEGAWRSIPNDPQERKVVLDEWILMPNHLHGIIVIEDSKEIVQRVIPERGAMPNSLSTIVGSYKSKVTRRINNVRRTRGSKVWQRGFYDRIIRNDREFNAIRSYIRANPYQWEHDREYQNSPISDYDEIDT